MELTYSETKQMLYALVHRFIKRYGGVFDDLLSVAHEAFCEAWLMFNSRREVKFTTYLWLKVWRAMQTDLRRRIRDCTREGAEIPVEAFAPESQPRFFLSDFLAMLSYDARMVVQLVLDTPSDFKTLNRANAQRRVYHKVRQQQGWSHDRIENAIASVRFHLLLEKELV